MKKYRVIQWATGTLGKEAMRRVIEDPARELIGVYTYAADKAGKDAGELCGMANTGVKATSRIEDILALDADVVLHCPKLELTPENSDREIIALLRSGKNVISSRGYQLPKVFGEEYERPLREAGFAGKATLFGTGIEPGFIYDTLAGTISGMCARIDEVRLSQWFEVNSRPYNTVFNVCLFGSDPSKIDGNAPFANTVGKLYFEEFSLIATHLGTELESYKVDVRAEGAPYDVTIEKGPADVIGKKILKGTTWGVIIRYEGRTRRGQIISLDMYWFVCPVPGWKDHDAYGIEIVGEPNLKLTFEYEDKWKAKHDPFHTMFGAHFNNIIPNVVQASPGILHLRPLTAKNYSDAS